MVRTHVLLPEDLVREIDALVGPRGRSAFLVETARGAVRRRKLVDFLSSDEPTWKDENHPELAEGAAQWVRKLRAESERATRRRLKGKTGSAK
jgi:Arc/MetJ-type ribon-helix-helix transcriptional regulator